MLFQAALTLPSVLFPYLPGEVHSLEGSLGQELPEALPPPLQFTSVSAPLSCSTAGIICVGVWPPLAISRLLGSGTSVSPIMLLTSSTQHSTWHMADTQ